MTVHDLKWPWRHDEGSPVTIFRLRMSILPVTRCLRVFWMVFVQKRRLSFFSPWLIMERSQNWPDLRSPISKFRDIRFIDTGTDINRWKFQGNRLFGVAMTNIRSFSEVRSLDVTWWPDHEWPGSEIFTKCAEKMYEQLCQKRRRSAPPFFNYLRTIWRGVFKHSPARRGLTFMQTWDISTNTILTLCDWYAIRIILTPNIMYFEENDVYTPCDVICCFPVLQKTKPTKIWMAPKLQYRRRFER